MADIGEYGVRIKPEVLAKELERDIDRVIETYHLDKREVYGDGLDLHEAKDMPFDTFKMLSDGDAKITRDDLARFTDTEARLMRGILGHVRRIFGGLAPSAAAVFRALGGEDRNGDGRLQVPRELSQSPLVQTAEDAFELSGTDGAADPVEGFRYVLKRNGVDTSLIDVTHRPR